MDETQLYFSKRKPRRCPACGKATIIDIVYGYPSPEGTAAALAGRIMLGGCCVSGRDPRWRCSACDTVVYPETLRGEMLDGSDRD